MSEILLPWAMSTMRCVLVLAFLFFFNVSFNFVNCQSCTAVTWCRSTFCQGLRTRRRVRANGILDLPIQLGLFWPFLTVLFQGRILTNIPGSDSSVSPLKLTTISTLNAGVGSFIFGVIECPSTEGRTASLPTLHPSPFTRCSQYLIHRKHYVGISETIFFVLYITFT